MANVLNCAHLIVIMLACSGVGTYPSRYSHIRVTVDLSRKLSPKLGVSQYALVCPLSWGCSTNAIQIWATMVVGLNPWEKKIHAVPSPDCTPLQLLVNTQFFMWDTIKIVHVSVDRGKFFVRTLKIYVIHLYVFFTVKTRTLHVDLHDSPPYQHHIWPKFILTNILVTSYSHKLHSSEHIHSLHDLHTKVMWP